MLPIAGQTAGPNGLKFFVDTQGGRGCLKFFNIYLFKLFFKFFFPRSTLGPSVSIYYIGRRTNQN